MDDGAHGVGHADVACAAPKRGSFHIRQFTSLTNRIYLKSETSHVDDQ